MEVICQKAHRISTIASKVKQPPERANPTDIKCRTSPEIALRVPTPNTIPSPLTTMAKLILLLAVAGAVSAARLDHLTGGTGEATRFENINNGDGNYRFSYETPNGISAQESGSPRAQGPEGPAVTAEGAFSYRAPDGQQISLSYTADENGFHPVGAHLPTPPPIPDAILKSLEFNRQNPSDDGAYNAGRNSYRF